MDAESQDRGDELGEEYPEPEEPQLIACDLIQFKKFDSSSMGRGPRRGTAD